VHIESPPITLYGPQLVIRRFSSQLFNTPEVFTYPRISEFSRERSLAVCKKSPRASLSGRMVTARRTKLLMKRRTTSYAARLGVRFL